MGLVVPPLRVVFDYAWFAGGFGAGLAYWVLSPRAARDSRP